MFCRRHLTLDGTDSKSSNAIQSYISDDDDDEEDFDMFEDNGEPDSDPGSPFIDILEEDKVSDDKSSKSNSHLPKASKTLKKSNHSKKLKRIT